MYHVEIYQRVRRACHVDGMSVREAVRQFGLHHRTIMKMLEFFIPPGYQRSHPIRRPRLEGFTCIIDAILLNDKTQPKKQHNTAKRIFERLREEYGFGGGYTIVKDYIREMTHFLAMDLPHSDGCFVKAYPTECTEFLL
jgi:transposase